MDSIIEVVESLSIAKAVALDVLIFLVIERFGAFQSLEMRRVFTSEEFLKYDNRYVSYSKMATSFMCAIIAWLTLTDAFNVWDTALLALAFVFIELADFFLVVLTKFEIGIPLFMVVQIILIVRHLQGSIDWIISGDVLHYIIHMIVVLVIFYGASILMIAFQFFPALYKKKVVLLIGIIVYLMILSLSCWAAWMTMLINYIPSPNCFFIMIGMSFFYCCDLCVGMKLITSGTKKYVFSTLTWLFYTPAIALLALSAYSYEGYSCFFFDFYQ